MERSLPDASQPDASPNPARSDAPSTLPLASRDVTGERLTRLITLARAVLVWDRLWPVLARFLSVVAIFVAAAGFGLWLALPGWARLPVTGLFTLAALATLWPLRGLLQAPSRAAALSRLDEEAPNRPATTAADALALGAGDPGSRALWDLHRARASRAVLALKPPLARPGLTRLDPYALRAAALVAAVAGLFAAGPEWRARLEAAFDARGADASVAAARLDGWIDPPLYTRLPPIMLDLSPDAEGRSRVTGLRVPVGSVLVVRAAGEGRRGAASLTVRPQGGLRAVEANPETAGASAAAPVAPTPSAVPGEAVREMRFALRGDATAGISLAGSVRAEIRLTAMPDMAPTIALTGTPSVEERTGLAVSYIAKDDYGFAALEAQFTPEDPSAVGRWLVAPPKAALTAPIDPTRGEAGRTVVDLADSPWGGARVRLTLVARDEAGQEGRSETVSLVLPQRPFAKPLAKALVEQRRDLVTDRETRKRVQTALDALRIAPDTFTPNTSEYLGLTIASERLRAARTDADLLDVAEFLWGMALRIEDGDLSDAERALRAAQEALRQALERGASPEEIRRLTRDLRQAMERFLREFAERERRDQRDAQDRDSQPNQRNQASRFLTPQDLNRMLNRMEELARRGDNAEAQDLLNQLNQILNNLRSARPNRNMDPRAREMNRALNELDGLTRDQQDLRDETFRQENESARDRRRAQRPGQMPPRGRPNPNPQQGPGSGDPQEGEGGEERADRPNSGGGQGQSLAERQQRLRDRLDQLRQRMERNGTPGGDMLGEAEDAMRQAERGLQQGDGDGALDAQGRALDALRRGAQNLARQMQPGGEPGDGDDMAGEPGDEDGQPGRAANNGTERDDPLGRPTRNPNANDNARFDRRGGRSGLELRVEEIIRDLRRRLGDPTRPREELDYFERLLRPR